MLTWEGKKIAMKPIPHVPRPAKEKKSKFISICNRGKLWVEPKENNSNPQAI